MIRTQNDLKRCFTVVVNPAIKFSDHLEWKGASRNGTIDLLARQTTQVAEHVNRISSETGVGVIARDGMVGLLRVSVQPNKGGQRALERAFKSADIPFSFISDAQFNQVNGAFNNTLFFSSYGREIAKRKLITQEGKVVGIPKGGQPIARVA